MDPELWIHSARWSLLLLCWDLSFDAAKAGTPPGDELRQGRLPATGHWQQTRGLLQLVLDDEAGMSAGEIQQWSLPKFPNWMKSDLNKCASFFYHLHTAEFIWIPSHFWPSTDPMRCAKCLGLDGCRRTHLLTASSALRPRGGHRTAEIIASIGHQIGHQIGHIMNYYGVYIYNYIYITIYRTIYIYACNDMHAVNDTSIKMSQSLSLQFCLRLPWHFAKRLAGITCSLQRNLGWKRNAGSGRKTLVDVPYVSTS